MPFWNRMRERAGDYAEAKYHSQLRKKLEGTPEADLPDEMYAIVERWRTTRLESNKGKGADYNSFISVTGCSRLNLAIQLDPAKRFSARIDSVDPTKWTFHVTGGGSVFICDNGETYELHAELVQLLKSRQIDARHYYRLVD